MFAFILIGYTILYLSEANDLLSTLWDTDVPVARAFNGKSIPVRETNLIVRRLSKVPFTEMLKYDVWTKLSMENRMEKFNPEEWSRFESLIPHLPISVLEKVNLTDNSIMSYFGQVKLSKTQLSKLAEDILLQNPDVLEDEEKLSRMGNIVCGINSKKMQTIKEPVLRSLMKTDFFHKIKSCDAEQLKHFLKIVEKHTVIGPPRAWHPETIKQAGILISALSVPGIREIQDKCFAQITPEVIESTPVDILKSMKNCQLKTLSKIALLSWRRKTRDLRHLYDNSGSSLEISFSSAAFAVILSSWHFSLI